LEAFSKSSLVGELERHYFSSATSSITYGPSKSTLGSTASRGFFKGISVDASSSLNLLREVISTNGRKRAMHHCIDRKESSRRLRTRLAKINCWRLAEYRET
jgi:hypothetical protein